MNANIPQTQSTNLCSATYALWYREVIRFLRQRNRVIGALGTPVVFWLLLGSGLNQAFRLDAQGVNAATDAAAGVGYLAYFFPGTILLIALFTAIFSTISIIEDRKSGFMQSVLVAPIPRLAIVLGSVLGGTALASLQASIFLLAWPIMGGEWTIASLLLAFVWIVLISMGLTTLGLCVAWPMQSTAGFHAIMNLFLMPLWFLSGAVFPVASASGWLQPIMMLNPLTYGHQLLAQSLLPAGSVTPIVPTWAAVLIVIASVALLLMLATRIVQRKK